MKRILIGAVVLAGLGLGILAWLKLRPAPAVANEDESPPPVARVQVGELKVITLHRYLTGYGTIAPAPASTTEPAADAFLAAPISGVVVRVNAVEGQPVKKGDVLVELNSASLTLQLAEEEVARQRKLYAGQNTSLRNLQNAEATLALLRVVSPLDGTVAHLNVTPGAPVDPTSILAEVIDLRRLAVGADFPAPEADELKTGQELQILTRSQVAAPVSFLSPTVDATNATIRAWARLPQESGLRPGQYVPLRVVTGTHTNALAAPAESIVKDMEGKSVISLVSGNEATQSPVKTGFSENGWVEVEGAGLKAGGSVVTVGAYGLPKQTKIEVIHSSADTNAP